MFGANWYSFPSRKLRVSHFLNVSDTRSDRSMLTTVHPLDHTYVIFLCFSYQKMLNMKNHGASCVNSFCCGYYNWYY